MAKSMRLNLIAEGVESDRHMEPQRKLGCDAYQGFLFSRAIDSQQATLLLKQQLA